MKFHEIQFPTEFSFGASGGPKRKSEIVQLANGFEHINMPWSRSIRNYNVATGIKTLNELHQIVEFFEFCNGTEFGFRWKDWADYKSAIPSVPCTAFDQNIGLGNGIDREFFLQKQYGIGENSYLRRIKKPVKNTVMIAVDENVGQIGRDYDVDYSKGTIHFTKTPEVGAPITAGFEFDVPVRFDVDEIIVSITHFEAGEIQNIDVKELMLWN